MKALKSELASHITNVDWESMTVQVDGRTYSMNAFYATNNQNKQQAGQCAAKAAQAATQGASIEAEAQAGQDAKDAAPSMLPSELSNAFITLESKGGEGRSIVLRFNQRDDAYAVHHFLMTGTLSGAHTAVAATTSEDADRSEVRQAIRRVLKHHKLTKYGDGVVEADLAHAVVDTIKAMRAYAAYPATVTAPAQCPICSEGHLLSAHVCNKCESIVGTTEDARRNARAALAAQQTQASAKEADK